MSASSKYPNPETENISDLFLNALQYGVLLLSTEGTILRANEQALNDLRPGRNIEGHKIREVLSIFNCDKDLLPEVFDELEKGAKRITLPANTFIQSRNKSAHLFIQGQLVRLNDREILFTFRNVVEDLTRDFMLKMALSSTKIFPWFYDMERNTMVIDSRYFAYTHIPTRDNTMTLEEFSERIHPEDWGEMAHAFALQLKGEHYSYPVAFRLRRGDDRYEWFEGQSSYLGQMEGIPYRIVGICMSTQSHKDIEEALTAAKDKAQESDRLKSAFLANMSHEIRTPLNAIVGFSGLLTQTDDQAERQEYISIINNSNAMLLQLVGDILDLSKIEAGTLEFSFADHNLTELMEELEQTARMKVDNSAIEVACTDHIPGCTIHTDRGRLLQVLHNFINNAAKFTEKGHIHFGFKQQADGCWYFYVEDTGCGIPADKVNSVFNRFTKLDKQTRGTGLGLAISKSIVERLGGEIGVCTTEGQGSTFWFLLPGGSIAAAAPTTGSVKRLQPEASGTSIPTTVLIAEDDAANYKLFEVLLKKHYTLLHAWNGCQAVEMFKQHLPDMILMDIRMPEMDGYQATAAIRELSSDVPIVAVTAFAYPEDTRRILASGFNSCLSKPVNGADLKKAISGFCHKW